NEHHHSHPGASTFPYTTLFRSYLRFLTCKYTYKLCQKTHRGYNLSKYNTMAKSKSDDLFNLIKSLNRSEKRYFKLFVDSTGGNRSEEHASELQSRENLLSRLLL